MISGVSRLIFLGSKQSLNHGGRNGRREASISRNRLRLFPTADLCFLLKHALQYMESMFEEDVQGMRRDGMDEFGAEENGAVLAMFRQMLLLRPEWRVTAEELLESEWMVKWALPELRC